MDRLTTNKEVSDMSMYELAHNSCYVKDGKARYRDFEEDIDARELARVLIKKYLGEDAPQRDAVFDDYICECLQYDVCSTDGLIAVFYRNLWAMAEMREKLKQYEDLEESGRLIKLPCTVGDTVYVLMPYGGIAEAEVRDYIHFLTHGFCLVLTSDKFDKQNIPFSEVGKTVFLTHEAVEVKLKEMEGNV